ncbi:MAG: hypothetical protein Hens3KO_24670 [Henriciella sp.]
MLWSVFLGTYMQAETANILVGVGAILAALIGPCAAVIISRLWEKRHRNFEQRHAALQTILTTRGRYADPAFTQVIRTIPILFFKNPTLLTAHENYMNAARVLMTDENQETVSAELARRLGILTSELLKDLGYTGLSSQQIEEYTAQSLVDREHDIWAALKALPHLANSAARSAHASEVMAKLITEKSETSSEN